MPILESTTKVEEWHIQQILVLCMPHPQVNPTQMHGIGFPWKGGILLSNGREEKGSWTLNGFPPQRLSLFFSWPRG